MPALTPSQLDHFAVKGVINEYAAALRNPLCA